MLVFFSCSLVYLFSCVFVVVLFSCLLFLVLFSCLFYLKGASPPTGHRALPRCPVDPSGGSLGVPFGCPVGSREVPGGPRGSLGVPGGLFWVPWGIPGSPWGVRFPRGGGSPGVPGGPWGCVLGPRGSLGVPGGRFWVPWGVPGSRWGVPWEPFWSHAVPTLILPPPLKSSKRWGPAAE